jgi:acyl phosphate:glycerol-3-phosphate acyltransferase
MYNKKRRVQGDKKMDILMNIIGYIIIILVGYLIGSIPFALIVGRLFYETDVRGYGSGNLGGTNVGRILGRRAGLIVIFLDVLKAFIAIKLAVLIIGLLHLDIDPKIAGLACVFGHCYPIFAGFRGGKGVAAAAGFILAIDPFLFVLALLCFMICICITKIMSLSVLITLALITIMTIILPNFCYMTPVMVILTLFIAYQHRTNIKRIRNNTEPRLMWLDCCE